MGVAKGAYNLVVNNPISHAITSLSAMPVQALAKAMGQPDPYANGSMAGVDITSSDQPASKYAEEEAGNALTLGSLFVPAGEAADAVTGGKGLLGVGGRIAANSALGAGQGFAGGMQSGQDWANLSGDAKTGAIVSGLLSGTGEVASGIINHYAAGSGDTQLTAMKNSLKTLSKNFNENSTETTNPITTLKQNNLIGDLKVNDGKVDVSALTNPQNNGSLDNLIQDQKDAGEAAAANMKGGIPTEDFKNAVLDQVKNTASLKQAAKVGKTSAQVEQMFTDYKETYGDSIPYSDLNGIRMQMNQVFDKDTWDAERAVGTAARKVLYSQPDIGTALKTAMQNEQELLNAKDFVVKLNAYAVKGGRMGKYLADMVGGIVGGSVAAPVPFVGPPLGAMAGAYATDKAMSVLQDRYFNPISAGPARTLQSVMPTLGAAKRVGQAALIPSLTGGGQ